MAFQDPVDAVYPPANRSQQDAFGHKGQGDLDAPAFRAFPITPSQEDLPTTIRGLYIGNSGNVFCKVAGGNTYPLPVAHDLTSKSAEEMHALSIQLREHAAHISPNT